MMLKKKVKKNENNYDSFEISKKSDMAKKWYKKQKN